MGECDPGSQRKIGTDNAVATIEILLFREHVHRTALASGVSALATGQFGHHAIGVHPTGQHVAMVAVGGDDGILLVEEACMPTTTASWPM